MGLLDYLRNLAHDFQESAERSRRQSQIQAFHATGPDDEYVTMTITSDSELERFVRGGWDLVRDIPPVQYNGQDITSRSFLVRRRREELRAALGL